MGRDRELKWLDFSVYPLSFFLYSPFKVTHHVRFTTAPFNPYLSNIEEDIYRGNTIKDNQILVRKISISYLLVILDQKIMVLIMLQW